MYNFSYFKENDAAVVREFMKQHPFAMIIGADAANNPVATQVPVLLKERDGELFIQAHIMRQTDHHKAFEHNPNVLVVFTGPHCYVSAGWYTNKQTASTWNYMSVHAKGELNFLGDEQLLELLHELTNQYENDPASPSSYEHLPEDYVQRLSKAIIGFEIKVTELDHVFKLSQNREEEGYNNIIQHLMLGNAEEKAVAEEMLKRRDRLF